MGNTGSSNSYLLWGGASSCNEGDGSSSGKQLSGRADLLDRARQGWTVLQSWSELSGSPASGLISADVPNCNDRALLPLPNVALRRVVRAPTEIPLAGLRLIGKAEAPLASKAAALAAALASPDGRGPSAEAVFAASFGDRLREIAGGEALGLRNAMKAVGGEHFLDRVAWVEATAETGTSSTCSDGGLALDARSAAFRLRVVARATVCPLLCLGFFPVATVALHERMVTACAETGEVRSIALPPLRDGPGALLRHDVAVFVGYDVREKVFYARLASAPENVVTVSFAVVSPTARRGAGVAHSLFGDACGAWVVMPEIFGRVRMTEEIGRSLIEARTRRDELSDPSVERPELVDLWIQGGFDDEA